MTKNPLLQKTTLFRFDKALPKHFKPAIVEMIKENRAITKKLLSQKKFTWDNFVFPLEAAQEQLSFVWGTIHHLNTVTGTQKVRTAYEKCLPLVTQYYSEISQHQGIYQAINSIADSKEYKKLDRPQQKIISDMLRDFRLAGVTLPERSKQTFAKLQQRLAELGNKFGYNVLDSSQNYTIKLTKKETQGLPEHVIAMGKANAAQKNQAGWLYTLDLPSYQALITYADSRALRKKTFIAFVTRASSADPFFKKWDNSKIITETLKIRNKIAKLTSFKNYAEYSLASKMAKNTEQVSKFLSNLAKKSFSTAKKEFKELEVYAKKHGVKTLQPWDLAYFEEKLSKEKFKLSQEELRPYFLIEQVLMGVFAITKKLFGITIKEKKGIPAWHPNVRFFEIYDQKDNLQGQLYMDLFVREGKRGGAWMDNYQTRYRRKNSTVQNPTAFLVCNFLSPIDNKPALLTHYDVLTLLHELGHCLQHLLTRVDYLAASGVNGIPWDAIELASQIMENWGWKKEGLKLLSKHFQTKKSLPPKILKRLIASNTYHAGIRMLRQLEFSLVDLYLHLESPAPTMEQIKKITRKIQKKTRVTPIYKQAQPLNSFSHIFAGGYAAGYYSYKWAEVLSADAFSKFEEKGIFDRKTGREFLKWILETGGSEDPMILFEKFRERPPKIDALLRHHGIVK